MNNYLVLSDNGTKHVSGDVMSRAAQPTAVEPPEADEDNVDSNSIVDEDNVSVVSDLSEDFELPSTHNYNNNDNNNVNDNNVNRRGPRMLNDLGPMQSPRLRSGNRRR